jgi:uncharacterized protein (DUF2237 family)
MWNHHVEKTLDKEPFWHHKDEQGNKIEFEEQPCLCEAMEKRAIEAGMSPPFVFKVVCKCKKCCVE